MSINLQLYTRLLLGPLLERDLLTKSGAPPTPDTVWGNGDKEGAAAAIGDNPTSSGVPVLVIGYLCIQRSMP